MICKILFLKKLQEFGLQEYFLYPQISWNSKAASIQEIAKLINIGSDAIAFIDRANASKLLLITTKVKNQRKNLSFRA